MNNYLKLGFVLIAIILVVSIFCYNPPNRNGAVQKNAIVKYYKKSNLKKNPKSILCNKLIIAIVPLGAVTNRSISIIDSSIKAFFHAETVILNQTTLPLFAFYQPRNRYKADSLLEFLKSIKPSSSIKILGLTEVDISTSSGNYDDWGIFGLGECPGNCCVISLYRLRKNVSKRKQEERLIKVALHELGHNFGLDHCKTPNCLMEDAEGTIKTVDNESGVLCKQCSIKLQSILHNYN